MNRLLIPAQFIGLTGQVQDCLFAAEQQGFDISQIELGVSPAECFELEFEEESLRFSVKSGQGGTTHLSYGTDATSDQDNAALENAAQENAAKGNREASLVVASLSSQQVILGAHYQGGFADLWLNSEGNTCAVRYEEACECEPHLAWMMTALVLDFPLEDALMLARAATKTGVSRETWPTEPELFPTPVLNDPALGITASGLNRVPFLSADRVDLRFYPVVDSVEWVERLLELGVKTVQLRIKNPSQPDLEQQIEKASTLGREHKAQLFINDYWQLAIKHGAYGVHLGQEDLEVADLDAIQSAGIRLGLSTHGYYELMRIRQLQPSYIALGHIFPTTTKQMPSKPQGLVRLARYQRLSAGIPTVAIGGIDLTNAEQVLACGADSLAVVRAVTQSNDPAKVIEAFNRLLEPRCEQHREGANAL